MDKNYGGVIWTNHVMERMRERQVKQGDAWAAWKRPDSSEFDKNKNVWVYQRTFDSEMIEVVAKKNERGQWIILSVWSRPVRKEKEFKKEGGKKNTFLQRMMAKLLKSS